MSTDRMIPLVSPGQFIILTNVTAYVVLIEESRAAHYYDGLAICETRARDVDAARAQLIRLIFGSEAVQALPAGSAEALLFYIEHYDGRLHELVAQLAACILTGQPQTRDGSDPSARARLPVQPIAPPSPVGATFQPVGVAS